MSRPFYFFFHPLTVELGCFHQVDLTTPLVAMRLWNEQVTWLSQRPDQNLVGWLVILPSPAALRAANADM